KVMSELMREDANAAVLRLDGVVADPVLASAGPADVQATKRHYVAVNRWAGRALCASVRIRAVAPDCVGALRATARLFAFAGVDGLEVVDVAVGLVEIAVAVVVIATPNVELGQPGIGRCDTALCGDKLGPPGAGLIRQEPTDIASAHDAAAVVAAVGSLVEGNLDPVAYV